MPKNPTGLRRLKGRPGYYYRDQRGKKDRLVKLSNDRETAVRKLRALRGEAPQDPVSIKEAVASWLKGAVATRRNQKFRELTSNRADDYLVPLYGSRRLASFTAEHCRQYRLRLEQHALSPQSVVHILSDLRCLLLWAVETGLIDRSPFPRRLMPRVPERPPARLTDEEVALCTALPGADGFECRVLIASGMRWGEAAKALASDVDNGALVIAAPKSNRVRRVPLAPSLVREVALHVGRLFRFRNGQTLALRVRAVVPGFTVHRARHTFAYRYLEQHGTLHALKELMGHSTLKTTLVYLRGLPELAEKEAREIVAR